MLDPAALVVNVAVCDMNPRSLREACQLLVSRLRGDDARRVVAKILYSHRKATGIDRMKLHEAGPSFVKQNVIAERTNFRENIFGIVDSSVVGALLDHGRSKRPRPLPRVWL